MADDTKSGSGWPDPDTERAQPGDVLGIERGGETTSLGDTEQVEDRRRESSSRRRLKIKSSGAQPARSLSAGTLQGASQLSVTLVVKLGAPRQVAPKVQGRQTLGSAAGGAGRLQRVVSRRIPACS